MSTPDGDDVVVGLCELRLEAEVAAGGSGDGVLRFSRAVSDEVRRLARVGGEIRLTEGNREIGRAQILGTE
jgi:hypothetical protein